VGGWERIDTRKTAMVGGHCHSSIFHVMRLVCHINPMGFGTFTHFFSLSLFSLHYTHLTRFTSLCYRELVHSSLSNTTTTKTKEMLSDNLDYMHLKERLQRSRVVVYE
jgi:hypothetical protein